MKTLLLAVAVLFSSLSLFGNSYYSTRLNDPKAVYLSPDGFSVKADGVADDSNAIQEAITKVRESTNQGILFVPSGRYRITKTIYIWPGIRLIGYGSTRPAFVLAANTPGFQNGPT